MLRVLVRNSFLYSLASVLNRGIALLMLPIYTRYLDPTDYGVMGLCSSVVSVLLMTLPCGVDASVSVYYYKLEASEYKRLLRTVWVWSLATPLLLVGLLEWIGPLLGPRLSPGVPWDPYLRLAVWVGYLTLAQSIPQVLLMVQHRGGAYSCLGIVTLLLNVSFQVYFIVGRGEKVLGSLRGQVAAAAVMALVSHVIVFTHCLPLGGAWWDRSKLASALRIGAPTLPASLSMWAMSLSDRWVLGRYVSLSEVGLYNLAYSMGLIVWIAGMGLGTAFTPLYYQHKDDASFRRRLPVLISGYFVFVSWVALAVSLLAPEIFRIMTRPAYHPAASLVPWIAASYVFQAVPYVLSSAVLYHARRTELTIVVCAVPALINIFLNVALVPRFGTRAAAITNLVCFMTMGAIAVGLAGRYDRLSYRRGALALAGAVAVLSYVLGVHWLTVPQLPLAILGKGLLLAVSGLVMARVVLDGDELRRLKEKASVVWRGVRLAPRAVDSLET